MYILVFRTLFRHPLHTEQHTLSVLHGPNPIENWDLRPKDEGKSGPKGLCYQKETFLIFVGLMLKVPLPCLLTDLEYIYLSLLLSVSLENRKYVAFVLNARFLLHQQETHAAPAQKLGDLWDKISKIA